MKKLLLITLFSAFFILTVPFCTYSAFYENDVLHISDETKIDNSAIRVFMAEENKAVEMDFREYIIGVVAAEMPVEFHSEALSAGACAAATLARLKMQSGEDEALDGAVISTDPKKHQAYITKEQMRDRWNGDFDAYYKKLCDAVDAAIDYSLTYENQLIIPAYHAISHGTTENAEDVWDKALPYLVSVDSSWDSLLEKYTAETSLSFDDFRQTMENEGCTFADDIIGWISDGNYTAAGNLNEISIGDKSFSGEELRGIFSLRSCAISFSMTKDGITIKTEGYGHGVGMSQYGANYLAKEGYSWKEILSHYYTGVEIEKV